MEVGSHKDVVTVKISEMSSELNQNLRTSLMKKMLRRHFRFADFENPLADWSGP